MFFRNRFALVVIVFIASALACFAKVMPTSSQDQVPPENWTYDAMVHLASDGLVPDMPSQRFEGDWIYTREEMAAIVRDTINALPDSIHEDDKAIISRLAAEFQPELEYMGASDALQKAEPYAAWQKAVPSGYFDGRMVKISSENSGAIGIYRTTGFGLTGKYITAQLTLSNRRRQFGSDEFQIPENFFVRGKTPNWEWEVGSDFMWWGPGYSGSMILSNNSPSFPFVQASSDINFGKHVGKIKLSQFASYFTQDGKGVYLIGRQWEKRFSKQFSLSFIETAKTNTSSGLLALAFPSFYLYEHIYLDDVDAKFNSFMGIDIKYRYSPKFETYLDFLADDMLAPSAMRTEPAWDIQQKLGFLLGAYWPKAMFKGTTGVRTEIIYVDPLTYTATRDSAPELDYTHDGLIIGHPVGPNSEAVFVRVDRKVAPGYAFAAEYLGRKPVDSDGINPFNTSRLSLLGVRDISPRFSFELRYDALKTPENESRYQLGATYAF